MREVGELVKGQHIEGLLGKDEEFKSYSRFGEESLRIWNRKVTDLIFCLT